MFDSSMWGGLESLVGSPPCQSDPCRGGEARCSDSSGQRVFFEQVDWVWGTAEQLELPALLREQAR